MARKFLKRLIDIFTNTPRIDDGIHIKPEPIKPEPLVPVPEKPREDEKQ